MTEEHDAQSTGRDDRPGPDVAPPGGGAAAGNGAGLGHLRDAQRRAVGEALSDLGTVNAFEEVMQRRGFDTGTALRRHLQELLRVLMGGARSKQEGGL